jgi:hypothetical protein
MPGGLIQIASYGSQDLTLTGNPQITFFTIVFRRYTNFGIRTIEVPFDSPIDFNFNSSKINSTITIPKTGDLLTKTTLKIKLPSFDLKELNKQIINDVEFNNITLSNAQTYYLYYDFFINFINKLQNIVKTFFIQNKNNYGSITYIQDLSNYILKFLEEDEYLQFFNIVNFFLYNEIEPQKNTVNNNNTNTFTNASLFYLNNDNVLTYIYNDYSENDYSYNLFEYLINSNMEILQELNKILYDKLINVFTVKNIVTMGWTKKIGIFIMENIELFIGSNIVTKFNSNYVDIYGQLNYKNVEIYNKMIGNHKEFNEPVISNDEKYLYVPIPFWFLNNYGLSIPLIALQFNDIQIKIKFRNLIDTVFFDIPNISSFTNNNLRNKIVDLIVNNSINIFNSQMEITMLFEYVYLDNIERKKFAQSSHEYLITQVQELTFNNVSPSISNLELDFFHCCKSMFWNAIQYKYINNLTSKNIYDKYTISLYKPIFNINNDKYVNYLNILYNKSYLFNIGDFIQGLNVINTSPINNNNYNLDVETALILSRNYINYEATPFMMSEISINGSSLVSQNSAYFNYLQVYNYYKNTPDLGINVYSFSLNPTESQPSGACNFSRIPKVSLNFKLLNPDNNLTNVNTNNNYLLIDNLASNENLNNYKIYIQVENYNVLRFIGGIVGIAFTY